MFETFRNAWRQAVDNFWEELQSDDRPGDARTRAMYAQVARARTEMERLERAISDCRRDEATERNEAEVCARRERLARDIGDAETATIAAEYRARHEERAGVLARKLEVLVAEQALCRRDLEEMERVLPRAAAGAATREIEDLGRDPHESDFQDLERAARDRAAEERLEELKRRSRS